MIFILLLIMDEYSRIHLIILIIVFVFLNSMQVRKLVLTLGVVILFQVLFNFFQHLIILLNILSYLFWQHLFKVVVYWPSIPASRRIYLLYFELWFTILLRCICNQLSFLSVLELSISANELNKVHSQYLLKVFTLFLWFTWTNLFLLRLLCTLASCFW